MSTSAGHELHRVAAWTPALGAVPQDGGARFSVWAPDAATVDVVFEREGVTASRTLSALPDGTFTAWEPDVPPGTRYRYRLDGGRALPDPASRYQPDGVHGPSAFVDPWDFVWTDGEWTGVPRDELVIYELHVGTFTPEGTFAGVESRLAHLVSLGVNAIELMPVAEAAGSRNWGYDGVDLFAPSHHYGTPDDLRRLVNAAHMHGLAVILDVVYNHLGPDGAYLAAFSRRYFSANDAGQWGDAVNLHGDGCEHVRAFFVENALHWIHEYHVDGLRLDATHALVDTGRPHFLAEFSQRVRDGAGRPIVLIAEDERNLAAIVQPAPRGYGLDAVWADDFHHEMRVALAGDREGYYADFEGTASDIATTARHGWFYIGQRSARTGRPRGSDPSLLELSRFVFCLQNHDQVGNRAFGNRLHHEIDPAAYRAASALLLLLPEIPLLFMGQEWAVSTPFLYFTDHEPALGRAIAEGRREEFSAFAAFADPVTRMQIPDPQDPSTFALSKLQWAERDAAPHAGTERLYRALLRLRRSHDALRRPGARLAIAAPDPATIVMRRGEWTVAVRLRGASALAVPIDGLEVAFTTEDAEFCEVGAPPRVDRERSRIEFRGPAAVVLRAR